MSKQTTRNEQPLAAFVARKTEIDALLARLQQLSHDHFRVAPEAVDWGHVGSLNYALERLSQVSDFLLGESEHAA